MRQAFSLLEMGMLLVIFGGIVAMASTLGLSWVGKEEVDATKLNLLTIEEALDAYRKINGRLPCPGDLTMTEDDNEYGYEAYEPNRTPAENLGECVDTAGSDGVIDATAAGTGVAYGSVPVNTLEINPALMRDQWGNLIVYYVTERATAEGSFWDSPKHSNYLEMTDSATGQIQVDDGQGGTRVSNALYALVSHGSNEHGAYDKSGSQRSTASATADEVSNADGADNTLVAKLLDEQFDDLVSFRERRQLFNNIATGPPTPAPPAPAATEGSAYCWGNGLNGRLGTGNTTSSDIPVAMDSTADWKQIDGGFDHGCGIQSDDTGWCWGRGQYGKLGNNSTGNQNSPVPINGGGTWQQISSGIYQSCGVKGDGTAWCWGRNNYSQLGDGGSGTSSVPVPVSGGGTWQQISTGDSHTCGIRGDGTAWCWGRGNSGQLGNGSSSDQTAAVPVSGGGTWKQINAFAHYTCGIKSDDTAWCWGEGSRGQLGDGVTGDHNVPVAVIGGGTWQQISTGFEHSCGLKSDGTAWCFGLGANGELGNSGTTDQAAPVAVNGGDTWKWIGVGLRYTCGIKSDDTAWCWGVTGRHLGVTGWASNQTIPAAVSGGASWIQITGAYQHTCAIQVP